MKRPPKRFHEPNPSMSSAELRFALGIVGINQSAFARWIRKEDRTIRSWLSGKYPVPQEIAYLLKLLIRTGLRPEDIN
jgi:DNA-binding transcriptional regulator YiaG